MNLLRDCRTTSTEQSEVGWEKSHRQQEEDPPIDNTIKSTAYLAKL